MGIVVIPRDITEEGLEAMAKELKPKPVEKPKSNKPRGWEAFWIQEQERHPEEAWEPPDTLTADELRAYRENKGWRQKFFGLKTGYGEKSIHNMEKGHSAVSRMVSMCVYYMMANDRLTEENETLRAVVFRLQSEKARGEAV